MSHESTLHQLTELSNELPSPLAVPIARVSVYVERREWLEAFLAGMDSFIAGLKWMVFIGIADVVQKLEDEHKFASRQTLEKVYPHIHHVLSRASHGHWVECARSIIGAYRNHPEWFFVPEFIAMEEKLADDPLEFAKKLDELVNTRNSYAHHESSLPTPARAKELWSQIEPFLAAMYHQLSALKDYPLIQFVVQPEVDEEQPAWYACDNYLALKGYNMHELALSRNRKERFYFGAKRPSLRRLYLFKNDFSAHLNLHPFVLYNAGGDLFTDHEGSVGATFLFNELQQSAMEYLPYQGLKGITLQADNEETSRIAGPIYQYFNTLRIITGASDSDRLQVIPGFPRRSKIINFKQIIAFHTEAFAGRNEYFLKIDQLFAGSFRAVWIRGFAGYGKTAFMAKLAHMHPDAIHYFISPEKGTANAGTFMMHVCQMLINRFRFADVLSDELLDDLGELKRIFEGLLARSNRALAQNGEKLMIIIDGLDESIRYASLPEEAIPRYLPAGRDSIPDNFFFVFTSRPEEVDLNDTADMIIDLKPFSPDEVATILEFYDWDRESSAIAYEKSGGQPLYFRFLIDGIKGNTLRSKRAAHLPEGIRGFYREFWVQCERDKAQKGNPEKASLAAVMQSILIFLAAAREPLSVTDLGELLARCDADFKMIEIRNALLKDNLGRFIIGAKSFSLFHDTLREFVLRSVRSTGKEQPFGEAIRYHEVLADWCIHSRESGYDDKHYIYHLLHARRFLKVVELLEDDSAESLVMRRRTADGGTAQLLIDLGYAVTASRELNSLDRIFYFSLMLIAVKQQKRAASVPALASVLLPLGRTEGLKSLFDECGDDDKWEIAADACCYFLRHGPEQIWRAWADKLTKLWMAIEVYGKASKLENLFSAMPTPSRAEIKKLISLVSPVEQGDLVPALIHGLAKYPSLSAELILDLPVNHERMSFSDYREELPRLSFILLCREKSEELAWRIFSMYAQTMPEKGILYLPAFLKRNPERVLSALTFPQLNDIAAEEFGPIISFMRMTVGCDGGRILQWLALQSIPVQIIGSACRASLSGDADEVTKAEEMFREDCGHASFKCLFFSLAFLSLARIKMRAADNPWQTILWNSISELTTSADVVRMTRGDDQMEEEFKTMLPKAGRILQEIGHLFPDTSSSFWFAMAASSRALEVMLDPRLHEWIRTEVQGLSANDLPPEVQQMSETVKHKLREWLDNNSGRDDVQGLILPACFSFLDQEMFREKIKAQPPIEGFSLCSNLMLINPEPDYAIVETLYPFLYDKDGDIVDINDMLKTAIVQTAFKDPARAYTLWLNSAMIDKAKIKPQRGDLGVGGARGPGIDPPSEGGESDVPECDDERDDHAGTSQSEAPDTGAEYDGFHNVRKSTESDAAETDGSPSVPFPEPRADVPTAQETREKIPSDDLALILLTSGLKDEAFDAMKSNGPLRSDDQLILLLNSFQDMVPALLEDLLDYALFSNEKTRDILVASYVEAAPPEERREKVLSFLRSAKGVPFYKQIVRYAMQQGFRLDDDIPDCMRKAKDDFRLSNKIEGLVIPWIESVAQTDPSGAARMLDELAAFQAMQGLEFVSQLQYSFDRILSEHLAKNTPSSTVLSSCASTLGPEYPLTRAAVLPMMIKGGHEQRTIQPLIELTTASEIGKLAVSLVGITKPDWLRDLMYERLMQIAQDKTMFASEPRECFSLLASGLWEVLQQDSLLSAMRQAAECHFGEDESDWNRERLEKSRFFLDGLSSDNIQEVAAAAARDSGFLLDIFQGIGSLNPRLAWRFCDKISNPGVRLDIIRSILPAAVKLDPHWAAETLHNEITAANSWELMRIMMSESRPEEWPGIAAFIGTAVSLLPDDVQVKDQLDTLVMLAGRSLKHALQILEKTKYNLGWMTFFVSGSRYRSAAETPPVDLFLAMARTELQRWKQSLADLVPILNQQAIDGLDFVELFTYLKKLPPIDESRRIAEEFADAVGGIVSSVKREKKESVEQFIRQIASLSPARALEWITRFNYKGIYLDDVLKEVLDADPSLFPEIYKNVLSNLNSFAREKILRIAITRMPLEQALEWCKREKMDMENFCVEFVQNGPLEMDKLLTLTRDNESVHFSLYLEGALAVRGQGNSTVEPPDWLKEAWEIFRKGEFAMDSIEEIEFRFSKKSRQMLSFMPQDKLGILFAFKPDSMEDVFSRILKDAPVEHQLKYEKMFNKIRSSAILPLFKVNGEWIIKRLQDWNDHKIFPQFLGDDLFNVLLKYQSAENALHVMALFSFDEEKIRSILNVVRDSAEMQECLEVLLSSILVKYHDNIGSIINIALHFAQKACVNPVDLLFALAKQFQNCRRILGIKSTDLDGLIGLLEPIAKGEEQPAHGDTAIAERAQTEDAEQTLLPLLSDPDKMKVEVLNEMISKYSQLREAAGLLIKERDNLLKKGRI